MDDGGLFGLDGPEDLMGPRRGVVALVLARNGETQKILGIH